MLTTDAKKFFSKVDWSKANWKYELVYNEDYGLVTQDEDLIKQCHNHYEPYTYIDDYFLDLEEKQITIKTVFFDSFVSLIKELNINKIDISELDNEIAELNDKRNKLKECLLS